MYSLARLILVRVMRQYRSGVNPVSALLQQQLADYVAATLVRKLFFSVLAAVAGVPVHRSAQGFAQRSGQSPPQFVLALRLDRACALLRRTPRTLAEIAADCGFASQQHMTQGMRQRRGTTLARCRSMHSRG